MVLRSPPLLSAENLAVRYPNGEIALRNVTFDIDAPSFMAIIGPNGSGKSTLVRTALGLIKPTYGRLSVMGYDSVKEHGKIRKMVRYVPQSEHIGLTVPMKV
ncbi:MAG: metal ABC transporter ATP-binding protein, partial [Candidatus Thorarchaeota archaeon]